MPPWREPPAVLNIWQFPLGACAPCRAGARSETTRSPWPIGRVSTARINLLGRPGANRLPRAWPSSATGPTAGVMLEMGRERVQESVGTVRSPFYHRGTKRGLGWGNGKRRTRTLAWGWNKHWQDPTEQAPCRPARKCFSGVQAAALGRAHGRKWPEPSKSGLAVGEVGDVPAFQVRMLLSAACPEE